MGKPTTLDSAFVLIECLCSMVDDLSYGLETIAKSANPDHDMEQIMVATLSLTNSARQFMAEVRPK